MACLASYSEDSADVNEASPVLGPGGPVMALAAAPQMSDAMASSNSAKRVSSGSSVAPRVRKDFAETFLFETFTVGYDFVFCND